MLLSISQGFLSAIGHPFPKMIFNRGRKKRTWNYLEFEEEEDKQLADSMASLAYLVFVQGITIDQLPMVLRWVVVFGLFMYSKRSIIKLIYLMSNICLLV